MKYFQAGLIVCVVLSLILGVTSLVIAKTLKPRLVGIGCSGANGPLYANEEDDFPRCSRIEAN